MSEQGRLEEIWTLKATTREIARALELSAEYSVQELVAELGRRAAASGSREALRALHALVRIAYTPRETPSAVLRVPDGQALATFGAR